MRDAGQLCSLAHGCMPHTYTASMNLTSRFTSVADGTNCSAAARTAEQKSAAGKKAAETRKRKAEEAKAGKGKK